VEFEFLLINHQEVMAQEVEKKQKKAPETGAF